MASVTFRAPGNLKAEVAAAAADAGMTMGAWIAATLTQALTHPGNPRTPAEPVERPAAPSPERRVSARDVLEVAERKAAHLGTGKGLAAAAPRAGEQGKFEISIGPQRPAYGSRLKRDKGAGRVSR